MIIAPSHVKDYCVEDKEDPRFISIRKHFHNSNARVYKLRCSCGSQSFCCFSNEHPDFVCECASCGKRIVVYDLAEYPCACKLDEYLELEKVLQQPTPVYPVYEYGSDFYETGADENAVTWFSVYIVKDGALFLAIDDETA